jgi:hypothetical protein
MEGQHLGEWNHTACFESGHQSALDMGKTCIFPLLNEQAHVVSLFQDERLTKVILEFLEETEVGRRYE